MNFSLELLNKTKLKQLTFRNTIVNNAKISSHIEQVIVELAISVLLLWTIIALLLATVMHFITKNVSFYSCYML